jgi:flagellar basal body-associated protein FliL
MKHLNRNGAIQLAMILSLVNTLAAVGALGALIYTRLLFKRPPITETGERKQLAEKYTGPPKDSELELIPFKQITANIATTAVEPGKPEGKLHYATIGYALEVRNVGEAGALEEIKTYFNDNLLQLLGKKTFSELTTVHGRFLLRSEMIQLANKLLEKPAITNIYFTHFIVQ